MKHTNRFIILLVLVALALLLYSTPLKDYFSLSYISENKHILKNFVDTNYLFSVMIYVLVYIIVVFLMLPITLMLNILAGFLFGVIPGTFYSVMSATIGALASLLAFRYLIGDWVLEKYGSKLTSFTNNFKKYGTSYLLSLQLLPVTPFPIINVSAGLAGIPLLTFSWTTIVGITPGTIIYCLAGRQLSKLNSLDQVLSWQTVGVLFLLSALACAPLAVNYIKKVVRR